MPDPIQKAPDRPPNKNAVLTQINTILAQHGGNISDIPQNSEYWWLVNLYRGM